MGILEEDISININILFFLSLISFFLLLSIIFIFKLRSSSFTKMINKTNSGFLGKSLYSLISVAVIGIGIVFGILAINSQDIIQIEAKRTVTGEIYTNNLLTDGDYSYIDFKLTPSVEGKVWGDAGSTFDIYWSFIKDDGDSFSYIENSKTVDDRSGMQEYFPEGSYEITVTVVYEGRSYTFTKQAIF